MFYKIMICISLLLGTSIFSNSKRIGQCDVPRPKNNKMKGE